ncbi:DUF4923 family protein [Bacteroides sp. 224]|uniref:DUF4923 family protein n=1 Tax=Bacteroides sp. 224 TaxID=2302936 RepID=UPI0013D70D0D|nr:DUF4923 family protein [Bacteroides sp. 224]NDV64327.1 DUF4923 family protein [Bacteroides sp. 224]
MNRTKLILVIAACLLCTSTWAQSWKDLLNKETVSGIVNAVTGGSSTIDLTGTWSYTGSAVEFESDDILKKAGGSLASSTVENKLNGYLSKAGVKQGITNFTFNADSTFTSTIGSRTFNGTYGYDQENKTVNLKYAGLVGLNAKVAQQSNSMSLMFDADKLLQLLVYFGNKSTNTTLKAITTLAKGYDGMMLGLEFSPK